MQVRPAEAGDFRGVWEIQAATREAPQWSEATWRALLGADGGGGHPARIAFVAEDAEGTLVGFAVASCVAEIAEVESIAVEAGARRQGMGRGLLDAVIAWAGGRGATAIVLEVRASNVAARRLYAGMGFSEQGERRRYYREPEEDAVLFRRAVAELHDRA